MVIVDLDVGYVQLLTDKSMSAMIMNDTENSGWSLAELRNRLDDMTMTNEITEGLMERLTLKKPKRSWCLALILKNHVKCG